MDVNFANYLQDFLKRNGIKINNIDFRQIENLQSIINQAAISNTDLSTVLFPLKVIFKLYENGVYLYRDDYKYSKEYIAIKNGWVKLNNEKISMENYIEHFLIDKLTLVDLYEHESIYTMGNPLDLEDDEFIFVNILKKYTKKSWIEKEHANYSNPRN